MNAERYLRWDLKPAYILHSRPYRETSLLVHALTEVEGLVVLVAKGYRQRKKGRAQVQPFQPCLLSWGARSDLGQLRGLEEMAPAWLLSGNALYSGLYVNELLVNMLARNDPHPTLFVRYHELLGQLQAGEKLGPCLRHFERDLLSELGFGLSLEITATGEMIQADQQYYYQPDAGPVRVVDDRQAGVSGAALLSLANNTLNSVQHAEIKRMMRQVIKHHLGNKELASYQLLR